MYLLKFVNEKTIYNVGGCCYTNTSFKIVFCNFLHNSTYTAYYYFIAIYMRYIDSIVLYLIILVYLHIARFCFHSILQADFFIFDIVTIFAQYCNCVGYWRQLDHISLINIPVLFRGIFKLTRS